MSDRAEGDGGIKDNILVGINAFQLYLAILTCVILASLMGFMKTKRAASIYEEFIC